MKLRDWLEANNVTFEAMARRVGAANGSVVHRHAMLNRLPRRHFLEAYTRETDGKVQPNDFLEVAE